MIVLGVDPGCTESAWAEMEMSARRPRFVCGGTVESRFIGHVAACQVDGMQPFGLCSIEKPVPPHPGGKVKTPQAWLKIVRDLMATALVAGEALGAASEHCPNVDYVTSHSARLALCGKRDATDAEVKAVLLLQVDNMPKSSNKHVRDAMAAAIVGCWRYERKRP